MPITIEYSHTASNVGDAYSTDMLVAVMTFRALVYGLASSITGNPPTYDMLDDIRKSEAYRRIAADSAHVSALLNSIEKSIGDAESIRELAEDYQCLYVGPQALRAPLWESVYRDPEHILFGNDTLLVRDFYATHGLVSIQKNNQPEDHISVELEFMHLLAARAVEELKHTDDKGNFDTLLETQRSFLENHLLLWAPQSFTLQLQHAKTAFYAAAAQLIIDFLPYDMDLLNETAQGEIHGQNN